MSLPLLHAGRTNPGLSAALDLRFALDKSLTAYRGPTPSFSRASTGSYFDGSGVLRYANVNVLLYSEQFENAYWDKTGNVTITSNQVTAPDGKLTADLLKPTASNATHYLYRSSLTYSAGSNTLSLFVKYQNHRWVVMQYYDGVISKEASFDLLNGVTGAIVSGASSSIIPAGSGWYRISLTASTASSSSSGFYTVALNQSDSASIQSWSATGTESVAIWGAQLESGSTVGTYCPTTSSANSAPRFNHTFNGTSWVSRGLLVEEQRTNLATYSEDLSHSSWIKLDTTISTNIATAPDGTQTADLIYPTTSGDYRVAYKAPASTNGQTYTISLFAKASGINWISIPDASGGNFGARFNLSNGTIGTVASGITAAIQNCGNGWYRCSVTLVAGAGGTVYIGATITDDGSGTYVTKNGTNGVLIWGAQVELGAFPTSYIGTTNSSVVRSADVCQITGSDFSGFWNGAEGSLVAEYDRLAAVDANFSAGYPRIATAVKTSDTSRAVTLFASQSPAGEAFFVQDGTVQAWFSAGSLASANAPTKLSAAYKANDFAASLNGASVATDTSGTIPSGIDRMDIGNEYGVTRFHNGHIARLRYFNKRLPNATLQLLSDPDPTLNLQFALNKTLTPVAGPAPSFSRASTGSYFDSTGTLKYANVNLLNYSEQFDNTYWTKSAATSISINTASAPDGTQTADLIYPNGSLGVTFYRNINVSGTNTFSIFAKSSGKQWIGFVNLTGSTFIVWFDVLNGVVGTVGSGYTATIQNVGNGWYRCSVTATGTWSYYQIGIFNSDNSSTPVTPNGTDGVLFWGAQAEAGASPTQYAKTEASATAGPRFDHVYSGGQWVSRGLLIEEQRTNLYLWSERFDNAAYLKNQGTISANQTTAPDGASTADKFTASAGTVNPYTYQGATTVNGSVYTFSIYVKKNTHDFVQIVLNGVANGFANFDINNGVLGTLGAGGSAASSIVNVGNGWYRCVVTYTTASTSGNGFINLIGSATAGRGATFTAAGTESVYLWGQQLELGSFPTSYIGTTNSSVVRSADVCQITGSDFSGFWNGTEGAIVAEYDRINVPTSNACVFAATKVTNPTQNIIYNYASGGNENLSVYNGNADQATFSIGSIPSAGASAKIGFAYKANDFAGTLNGAAVVTDTSGTVTAVEQIGIGYAHGFTAGYNGHIARLRYYPTRLTNSKLQELST